MSFNQVTEKKIKLTYENEKKKIAKIVVEAKWKKL